MAAVKGRKGSGLTGVSEKVTRLLELYSLIGENRYPTLDYLAGHFGVTAGRSSVIWKLSGQSIGLTLTPTGKATFCPPVIG